MLAKCNHHAMLEKLSNRQYMKGRICEWRKVQLEWKKT
jgi:hypothetical protein